MKKSNILYSVAVVAIAAGFYAFTVVGNKSSTLKGWVTPKDAGISAWAISQKDTFKTHVTTDGIFEILDVKPGTYSVVIQAVQPYKAGIKDGVVVTEGSIVDIGEIKLEK